MKKVLIPILSVLLTLCLFAGCSSSPSSKEPEPTGDGLYTLKKGSEWFKSFSETTSDKSQIIEIIFDTKIPQGKTEKDGVNLTDDKNGKIKGYIVPNEGNYKIYIVGDRIIANEDCSQMFYDFSNLKTITFGDIFDTSHVTNMTYMFKNCTELATLDLSKFNTQNVTDMSYMFSECYELETLDFTSFDFSKITNMEYMFWGCESLSTVTIDKNMTESIRTNFREELGDSCDPDFYDWVYDNNGGFTRIVTM